MTFVSVYVACVLLVPANYGFGSDTVTENQLFGEWSRGAELGYSVSLNLAPDHTYVAKWFGCAVDENGPLSYGSAKGAWKLDGDHLVITPTEETNEIRGDLKTLELRIVNEKPTLWPTEYPRVAESFGITEPLVFQRQADIEAEQKAEDAKPRIIPPENRGPIARECTMDSWWLNQPSLASLPPIARFTIPEGWGVSPGFEGWPDERDSWWIVPLARVNERPDPKIDIEIDLYPLQQKDDRHTQRARALSYQSFFKKDDAAGLMQLLGVVKTIRTKQFGDINVYHFRSEHWGEDWIAYLFGKHSVAAIHLRDHDGKSGGSSYLPALEEVTKSVSLNEPKSVSLKEP